MPLHIRPEYLMATKNPFFAQEIPIPPGSNEVICV